jgi:ElaB/YqjD/DUF883 family membrane-anchored ribosome-binding protein
MAASKDPLTGNSSASPYTRADSHADPEALTSAIQGDIERTRSQMDQTLEELEERLTPSRLLDDSWQFVKESSASGANRVWNLAKEHPLPALTVGVGLGWLIYESRHGGRLRGGNGRELVRSANGKLRRAKRRAGQAVEDLGDKASDAAGQVKRQARQLGRLGGRLRDQAGRAKSNLGDFVEERPFAAGAATLALGLLAGLMVPATEREDEWLGEKRDELLAEVKEASREALEKGKELAHEAVDTLKEELEEHGVTAQPGVAGTRMGFGPAATTSPAGASPESEQWRPATPGSTESRQ